MLKIGFIDYWLDEWHANNYPAWIEKASAELGLDCKVTYAWAELSEGPNGERSTKQWCEDLGITQCASIEELCEKSDYIIVLAPSNPEKHLEYARIALSYGKNTYIDKTFAPSESVSREIYDIADKRGVNIFTTSALRYGSELSPYRQNARGIVTTGGGRELHEYIIHQIEMVVKCMGVGARSVDVSKHDDKYLIRVRYSDGRQADMFFLEYGDIPFTATVTDEEGHSKYFNIQSDMFYALIKDILRFFTTGCVPFDREESFEVMRIRDMVLEAIR